MIEEDVPTVFVVPPNDSLKCPLHFGVFADPVDTPCGCTFCLSCISQAISSKHECPLHASPLTVEQLSPNERAQVLVHNLLIHCKGGLQKTVSGEWITSPSGCKLWISLGKRKEHEDNCSHVNLHEHAAKREIPAVRTCDYREQGCLFTGHTEQDILLHQELCGYGRLLRYIELLQTHLAQKDAEIAKLNNLLGEQEETIRVALPSVPNVGEILDSISRGLEKLDEDSTRLFEDAKDTLKKTKSAVVNSSAFQTSLQVLNSIKEVVESARTEFVAKMAELELIAKCKINSLTSRANKNRIANITYNDFERESAPTNTPSNNTSTYNTENNADNNNNNNAIGGADSDNNNNNTITSTPPSNTTQEESEIEGDEDLKEFLKASKQEYLKDQASRIGEEAALRQAMRLSLLDLVGSSQN